MAAHRLTGERLPPVEIVTIGSRYFEVIGLNLIRGQYTDKR